MWYKSTYRIGLLVIGVSALIVCGTLITGEMLSTFFIILRVSKPSWKRKTSIQEKFGECGNEQFESFPQTLQHCRVFFLGKGAQFFCYSCTTNKPVFPQSFIEHRDSYFCLEGSRPYITLCSPQNCPIREPSTHLEHICTITSTAVRIDYRGYIRGIFTIM